MDLETLNRMQLHSFGVVVVCSETGEECNALYAESPAAAQAGKGLSPAAYEKLKAKQARAQRARERKARRAKRSRQLAAAKKKAEKLTVDDEAGEIQK